MRNHYIITRETRIPLVGVHVFGIIDRGTNLLQVRPISGCPLNCVYCSVDEGPYSRKPNTYQVQIDYLLDWFNKVARIKGCKNLEAHIDGIGEPLMHKKIPELVRGLRKNTNVKNISMQTNGVLLSEKLLKKLEKEGLNRINLSINTFDSKLAKKMAGTPSYNINKIIKLAKLIADSKIELLIAPVLTPGFNESSIKKLISFAKELNAGIGIQKYEKQKHGRRLKIKEQSWYKFRELMKKLQKEFNCKLLLNAEDFNIKKCNSVPKKFKKNDKVKGKVVLPGWLSNERIISCKNRLITVFNCKNSIGDLVNAKIVKTKHNLYLAKKV